MNYDCWIMNRYRPLKFEGIRNIVWKICTCFLYDKLARKIARYKIIVMRRRFISGPCCINIILYYVKRIIKYTPHSALRTSHYFYGRYPLARAINRSVWSAFQVMSLPSSHAITSATLDAESIDARASSSRLRVRRARASSTVRAISWRTAQIIWP